MSPMLNDLARHSGQLSLSFVFMLLLALVLYSETHISEQAIAWATMLLSVVGH